MPWKPGESGNPLGRPRGSKNRFSEIKEGFTEAFERMGGVEALVTWIQAQPKNQGDFYRILAGMMPRDLTIEATDTRRSAIEYSTGELIALLGETDEEADEPKAVRTARTVTWPANRNQGEQKMLADKPSATVVDDTGPVEGNGS